MLRLSSRTLLAGSAVLALAATLAPSDARAHFHLDAPASWAVQDSTGSPQKAGPCGESDGPGSIAVATNMVTTFRPGETITIAFTETVPHPGHYRVALATNNRSELPPDPVVTAGATACGTAIIQAPPLFPVLADGLRVHTSPFLGPQTMDVTLPSNVTCTNCTLQVIEFMSSHGLNDPGGCFYHHCANISIQGAPIDGGAPVSRDAAAESSVREASSLLDASGETHDDGASSSASGGSGGSGGADSGSSGGEASGTGGGGAGSAGGGGSAGGVGTVTGGAGGQTSGSGGSSATSGSGGSGLTGGSGGSGVDAGTSADPATPTDSSGCSCTLGRASGSKPAFAGAFSFALILAALRRRSRRS